MKLRKKAQVVAAFGIMCLGSALITSCSGSSAVSAATSATSSASKASSAAAATSSPAATPADVKKIQEIIETGQKIATKTDQQMVKDANGNVESLGLPYKPVAYAPTTAAAPVAKGETFSYSFPMNFLVDPNDPSVNVPEGEDPAEYEPRNFVLTKMDAVVGVPAGNTPRPVVYILHATHPNCTNVKTDLSLIKGAAVIEAPDICITKPSYNPENEVSEGHGYVQWERGMTYLVNSLRDAGFVAVAIDVVASDLNIVRGHINPDDIKRLLLEQHRQVMAGFAAGETYGLKVPANFKSVIDTEKFAIVGHSSSGGYALATGALGQKGLFATVGIQPSLNFEFKDTDKVIGNTPILAIAGSCDEQVPLPKVQSAVGSLIQKAPDAKIVGAVIAGTSHAALNQFAYGEKPLAGSEWEGDCVRSKQATQSNSQEAVSALISSFLQQSLDNTKEYVLPSGAGAPMQIWYQYNVGAKAAKATLTGVDTKVVDMQTSTKQWGAAWDKKKYPAFLPEEG